FFFQAEDGIRDFHVTGVQTCALPILAVFDDTGKRLTAKMVADRPPYDLEAAFAAARETLLTGEVVHYATSDHFVVMAPTRFGKRSEERRVGKGCGERSGGQLRKQELR